MSTSTKAQHTPGPWHLEINDTAIRIFPTNDRTGICELRGTNEIDRVNARLIASAPEYFAAVDYWLEQIYDGEPLKDWQQQLIAAHKKARGE